ncbi:uncharacterized protein LOC111269636 isoform X4 [Varroa jacobsoni]|uniref:uncharacterized protein LOC111269636 isoform X4 n=1 Tax=Varroa jacobsoni TaxID=62625 RepID=UPI000BF36521|nr:uncharacterized protein LOC111269636 isoform X4 [Varroa jacobsoni]
MAGYIRSPMRTRSFSSMRNHSLGRKYDKITMLSGVTGLRLTQLGVPSLVRFGEPTWLNCSYALDRGERLYSIKWYKDNVEIYSHIPGEVPATKAFQHPGVDIDVTLSFSRVSPLPTSKGSRVYIILGRSTVSDLFLRSTDAMSDGRYRCEVSQEVSFTTERAKKDLLVYDIPDSDPVVVGLHSAYRTNDLVNATCYFGPLKGTSCSLSWYINGTKVKKELESLMDRVHDDGRVTLVRSLVFSVQPRHVDHKGKLRLRCRGQIGVTYQLNSEEIRVRARTNSSRLHVIRGTEMGGPQIAGLYSSYRKHDGLVATCRTRESLAGHRDNLTWFVNDRNASDWTSLYPAVELDSIHVQDSELQLRVPLTPGNFQRNELRLRCGMMRGERFTRVAEVSAHVMHHRFSGFAHNCKSASRYQRGEIFKLP